MLHQRFLRATLHALGRTGIALGLAFASIPLAVGGHGLAWLTPGDPPALASLVEP
ncbi:MAG TPA: hypothetical protein VH877_34250 [Polyangia bacterium]|jgi:hypothetical protein|nr:hypothetical protein [Polyangia bacterium]